MLNLVQHLTKSITYETLKQVQGDKLGLFTRPSKVTNDNKSIAFALVAEKKEQTCAVEIPDLRSASPQVKSPYPMAGSFTYYSSLYVSMFQPIVDFCSFSIPFFSPQEPFKRSDIHPVRKGPLEGVLG